MLYLLSKVIFQAIQSSTKRIITTDLARLSTAIMTHFLDLSSFDREALKKDPRCLEVCFGYHSDLCLERDILTW